ncbi:uncharacterized protein [Populus alba]|uniref:uncharacterized protein isoform X2 n=1 Tax=Populus alba TaxID=43335 RepID=UPI003CC71DC7
MMLICRLFVLNFLLLWQPGTGGANTSINNRIDDIERNGTLPEYEVRALRVLSQTLQSSSTRTLQSSSTQLPLSSPICSEDLYAEIKCGSTDNTTNGAFRSVTEINLRGKRLDGSIHYSIGLFKNLEILYLYYNQLSGGIPSTLGQLQHLKYLDLSSNSLTGSIPPSLTKLQNLEYLLLSSNDLDGTIPTNLKGLQSLRLLDLSHNKLTGPIPDSIGYCQNLTVMALDDNDLHGELPKELGNLINLLFLYLTANNFNGTIPTTYEDLTNLRVFAVGGNYLSGPIPGYIEKWVNLTALVLIGNNFEGNLPAKTFSLTKLRKLWVSDVNNPGISFPPEVIREPNSLFSVVLRNCNINGPIPKYIGKWPKLSYLDLSFNNLNGSIPETFRNLTKLFLTRNMLTGELPSWITNNPNKSTVTLSNNFNFWITLQNCPDAILMFCAWLCLFIMFS